MTAPVLSAEIYVQELQLREIIAARDTLRLTGRGATTVANAGEDLTAAVPVLPVSYDVRAAGIKLIGALSLETLYIRAGRREETAQERLNGLLSADRALLNAVLNAGGVFITIISAPKYILTCI